MVLLERLLIGRIDKKRWSKERQSQRLGVGRKGSGGQKAEVSPRNRVV